MGSRVDQEQFDVAVIGGGAAGIAAAIAASKMGARTVLVESGPMVGGELISGLNIAGVANARGEWIVGGVLRELLDSLDGIGGFVGKVFDWRMKWGACVDPELLKIVIVEALARHEVTLRLYSFVEQITGNDGSVEGLVCVKKPRRSVIKASLFVDCSGDGDIAMFAGAETLVGGEQGEFQPVSLVFRMGNVDYRDVLDFIRKNPEQTFMGENPAIGMTPAECGQAAYEAGYPSVGIAAKDGGVVASAINSGRMFPCTAVYMWPTSIQRREVGMNITRVAGVDATNHSSLSDVLKDLTGQVAQAASFCREAIPGFQDAYINGVAPRIGVRETRRIVGDRTLTASDVIEGQKFPDGIGKGGHHIDIHGSGTYQQRIPVKEGMSYDIPYGCLVPAGVKNVLVAGRPISSDREANGSARVMGTCLATGQAAGVAAAMGADRGLSDIRELPIDQVRASLREQGAILDGTA